jgi:hypothetical protein
MNKKVERLFEAKVTMFQCLPFLLLARLRETKWSSKNGGVCGWAGNNPKENKIRINKDAQTWISADQMIKHLAQKIKEKN